MMIITLTAGLARAGELEMSSHGPARALELQDKPQGRNAMGKQCWSRTAWCLRGVISFQVQSLSPLPLSATSAWAELGSRHRSRDAT